MRHLSLAAVVAVTALAPSFAQDTKPTDPPKPAETAPVRQIAPEVTALLTKASEAHKALTGFSATLTVTNTGPQPGELTGTIQLTRPDKLRIDVKAKDGSAAAVLNGKVVYRSSSAAKAWRKESAPTKLPLQTTMEAMGIPPLPIFGWLMGEEKALDKILSPDIVTATVEPDATADGVPVSVVKLLPRGSANSSATAMLYLGKTDNLLRRVVVILENAGQKASITEEYTVVTANPTLAPAVFTFTPPAGFKDETPKPLPPAPKLGPKAVTTKSGLKYEDLVVGKGAVAKNGTSIKVHYTGTLTNGVKFDSSRDSGKPFELSLPGQVIQGWNEGIVGMKVGGKRRLVIPPGLGYGAQGTPGGPIPPNATLIFDIELLSVSGK